jgi:hypothetical protein
VSHDKQLQRALGQAFNETARRSVSDRDKYIGSGSLFLTADGVFSVFSVQLENIEMFVRRDSPAA